MQETSRPLLLSLLTFGLLFSAACQTGKAPVSAGESTTRPESAESRPPLQSLSVPQLRALLRDPDLLVRIKVVDELGRRKPMSDEAASALVEACADSAPLVRRFAAGALAGVRLPDAATVLVLGRLLKDPELDPRQSAARTLATLAPQVPPAARKDLAPMLAVAASDRDESVRAAAVEALGAFGPEGARQVPSVETTLGYALTDSNENVRAAAAAAIGQLGSGIKGTVALLEKALGDPVHTVRKMAVIALEKMGPPAAPAAKALARQLRGREIYLRVFAADALAAIGPGARAALPELRALVARGWAELEGSPEMEARDLPRAAARAIESLEGKAAKKVRQGER